MVTRRVRRFERLGNTFIAQPLTLAEEIEDMRAGLEANEPLTEHDRWLLINWLRWMQDAIAGREDIRVYLGVKKLRGAPRSDRAWWLALDYATRKLIHGKDAAALAETSATWGDPIPTIKDAYTDWRAGVERGVIEPHLKRRHDDRDKALRELLEYAAAHLSARPKRPSRKKSS